MQTASEKLNTNEINKLERDYINSNSAPFVKMIQKMINSLNENIGYLEDGMVQDFNKLYDLTKEVTPAALPYAELTTLVFGSNDVETFSAFIMKMDSLYISKFEELKKANDLCKEDVTAISAIAKSLEHLNLAVTQKNNLYNEQKEKLTELDISGNEMTEELRNHTEDLENYKKEIEEYKAKYDKMTIDFLSMMGIFSTIIFAVFGGLSQVGAIGGNLSITPLPKILLYISLSSITLICVVFISFNAISKLSGMNLRSCSCSINEVCEHKVYERHPTLSFSLFFFVDLFLFSIVLTANRSSGWFETVESIIAFNNTGSIIRAIVIGLFFLINIVLLVILSKSMNFFKKTPNTT